MLLLPLTYLPPISWMALLTASDGVLIEAHENYIKSSFRNRCLIEGSNGLITLSIPIDGGRDHHQPYASAAIEPSSHWQHRHLMSIISCYGSAPYFEHYIPHFQKAFTQKPLHLFDFNREMLLLLIRLMKLECPLNYTQEYLPTHHNSTDLRHAFKKGYDLRAALPGRRINLVPYIRVFGASLPDKDISCIDLLFNAGPYAADLLRQMMATVV